MKIVYFHRKTYPHQFSIERVFGGIQNLLTSNHKIIIEKIVMPFYSVGIIPRIRNLLWSRKHQGDINHITGDVHYIALGLNKRKTILTVHDLNFLNHPNPLVRFVLKIFWLTLPIKNVTYITVVSEATKKDLLTRIQFPEDRIKVIPNYYDPACKPFPKEFDKTKPRMLQIGTKENKNVLRLIKALHGIDCHLVIVGGNNKGVSESLAQHKMSYTWLQNLSDAELIEQYRQCDILSFVSTIEGFGMPILEAQANGRVVVTSNVYSMPEVAGVAASYVNPFDVDSIREGILKVIHDDHYRQKLIRNGFDNVRRFEIKRVAAMYHHLYNEVLYS